MQELAGFGGQDKTLEGGLSVNPGICQPLGSCCPGARTGPLVTLENPLQGPRVATHPCLDSQTYQETIPWGGTEGVSA